MQDNVYLVVTSAFMLAGLMALPGEVVEVTDGEARDLLSRGKARVATVDDGLPADEAETDASAAPEESETEGTGAS